MKNFSKNRDFSKRKRNDGDQSRMHSAVCATCGRNCEVPFRPTGNKPIYCSSCFEKEGGSSTNRRNKDNRDYKEVKKMFSATCADCKVRCEVPFRPTGDKPIYCSDCFANIDPNRNTGFKKTSKEDGGLNKSDITLIGDQLISINSKLEKILLVLKKEEKEVIKKDENTKEKKQPDKKEVKKILTTIEEKNPKKKEIKEKIQKKITPKKEVKKTLKPVKEKKKVIKKSSSQKKK